MYEESILSVFYSSITCLLFMLMLGIAVIGYVDSESSEVDLRA